MENFSQQQFQSIPTRRGDFLQLSFFSSVTNQIRIITQNLINGKLVQGYDELLTLNGLRTKQDLTNLPLTDGFLVSVIIQVVSGTVLRGQVFCKGQIQFGDSSKSPVRPIISNYVTSNLPVVFPYSLYIASTDGVGFVQRVAYTGASTNTTQSFVIASPTNTRWKLYMASVQVTTGAGGSNRLPDIFINDAGTNPNFYFETLIAMPPATSQQTYFWSDFAPQSAVIAVSNYNLGRIPLPSVIPSGGNVTLNFFNGNAGDTVGSFFITVEELLDV